MVKENPERIVTTRHWMVGPPVSLYSYFFHYYQSHLLLGPWQGPKTEGREGRQKHTQCRGGGGSSTWRVGAARCHLISAQLITSHSITHPPPARPSLFQPPLLPARTLRGPKDATPTPLALCALVGHSWSRSLPPHPLLLRARAAQLQAPACLPAQPITCIQTLHTFTHSVLTLRGLRIFFLYSMW
jgi:hypothetical protein